MKDQEEADPAGQASREGTHSKAVFKDGSFSFIQR